MTPDQIRQRARAQSLQQGLALTATKEGETSTQYFQSREAYDSFVTRALHLGYTLEALAARP